MLGPLSRLMDPLASCCASLLREALAHLEYKPCRSAWVVSLRSLLLLCPRSLRLRRRWLSRLRRSHELRSTWPSLLRRQLLHVLQHVNAFCSCDRRRGGSRFASLTSDERGEALEETETMAASDEDNFHDDDLLALGSDGTQVH